MAGSFDDTIVRLATASNEVELISWQQALEDGGIHYQLQREYTATYMCRIARRQPELWVLESDVDAAKAILTKLLPWGKTAELYFGW
jgi:hypothetical protein